jgi:hypothetical protein
MTEHQTSRTLVKSAPELWAECSDAASLAKHLGAFGEIRITKLEPESTVAWEGAAASGTVQLESSGWGTRVTLTVTEEQAPAEPQAAVEPEPVAVEPEPVLEPESEPLALELEPAPRAGMFARFRLAFRRKPVAAVESEAPEEAPETSAGTPTEPEPEPDLAPEPVAEAPPASEPDPVTAAPPAAEQPPLSGEAALVAALDSLGKAHHRPYSRA